MLKRLPPGEASPELCAFIKQERTMSLMSCYLDPLQGEAETECVRAEVTICWEQGSTQAVWGFGKTHCGYRP